MMKRCKKGLVKYSHEKRSPSCLNILSESQWGDKISINYQTDLKPMPQRQRMFNMLVTISISAKHPFQSFWRVNAL